MAEQGQINGLNILASFERITKGFESDTFVFHYLNIPKDISGEDYIEFGRRSIELYDNLDDADKEKIGINLEKAKKGYELLKSGHVRTLNGLE